uniref:Small ribosomal subunit protein uS4c n=1 Tax=Derbesia sp. WEST4838 TaxID=1847751 RepID=A0A1C9JBG5_9CHLO|nr:ribosomal protein S4 [Derbesia sp. WEST4838]AOP19186.1 ribosomal protein S4 [Derbesia sp. WEST4838]
MARYRGPKLKIIRRLGKLPGLSQKISHKKNPPGQHGRKIKKPSQYAIRLMEKQKLRFHYGLGERQLFNYLKKARKNIRPTTEVLVELLEMRLDNIIFRLGISPTINAAKQLISHCHIYINNKKISISSYQCQINDKITIKGKPNSNLFNAIEENNLPSFVQFDKTQKLFTIQNKIERADIILELNELLVVEYYSKN